MGFLDKFLGGKSEEPKQTKKLQFSEVEGWIKQQKAYIEDRISKDSESILNEVSGILNEIKKRNEGLTEATMHKDVQQRIRSIVSSSRDNYVTGVRNLMDKLEDLDTINAKETVADVLSDLHKLDSKYGERVYFGFPDEIRKVKKGIKNLAKVSAELEEAIGGKKEKLALLDKSLDKVRAINDELETTKELNVRIENSESAISNMEKQKEGLEGKGESIKGSQRAEDLDKSKGELSTYTNKRNEIEAIILNTLAPLKRVFKKYKRVAETGRYPLGNVTGYLDNPVGTFLDGDETFEVLISNVKKAVDENGLELTSGEKDKILKKISSINVARIRNLRVEYIDLKDKIDDLESQVSKLEISDELEGLNRKAGSMEKSISEEKGRLDKAKIEFQNKQKDISQKEGELASELSKYMGGKCEIIQ